MLHLAGVSSFALSITFPICFLLLFGTFLKRIGIINEAFCESASVLVFKISLPLLLFKSVLRIDEQPLISATVILFLVLINLALFVLFEWLAAWRIQQRNLRGLFVQGSFRGNIAIVGLAYIDNAYGANGLSQAAFIIAIEVILLNVFSVITLSRSLGDPLHQTPRKVLRSIALNPLILGILAGGFTKLVSLQLPTFLISSIDSMTQITLPLALLCAGASLSYSALCKSSTLSLMATAMKLLVVPLLFTFTAYAIGIRDQLLGILFLLSSTPTAAASYVMVRAMHGNAQVAANIIALTTLGSVITTSLGYILLVQIGWLIPSIH